MGFETYGCSYTDTDKGISLLDHFAQINIIDFEKVKEYFIENQIDYIYSVGSDIAVPTVSKVAEETGNYSFVSLKTAEVCCNKHLMRDAMGNSRFNLPYIVCSSYQEIDFARYGKPSAAMVEEYLHGNLGKKPEDVNAYAASMFYAMDRYASY